MNKKAEKYRSDLYVFRKIRDLKQMMNSSAQLYGDKTAYMVKDRPGGPYIPISYNQLKRDVDGLGTALLELGLKGKKVAVIGDNRYEWLVAHMAAVCGVGSPFRWTRNFR